MTKQYTYIEYEKLSDAVIDWENGEPIYRKRSGEWVYLDHDNFCRSVKYAKRVEVKENTVEAWGVYKNGNFFKIFNSKERADNHMIGRPDFKLILLTGSIKG
jgi:hypothetical protein